jgi:hypothetical protein
VTSFFLPSSATDTRGGSELAYATLREEAEACTGSISSERRIHEIECRLRGRDRRLRVGERDASDGRMIAAILKLGRDAYTVHHLPAAAGPNGEPLVLRRTEVYSVSDFD